MFLRSCLGLLFYFSGFNFILDGRTVGHTNGCFGLWFRSREVHSVDGLRRTNGHTLTAQAALVKVDVRNVVLDGNGTKRALLLALATTDAGSLARLHGSRSLVLVDTTDEDTTILRSLLAQFNDVTRTSLDTSAA